MNWWLPSRSSDRKHFTPTMSANRATFVVLNALVAPVVWFMLLMGYAFRHYSFLEHGNRHFAILTGLCIVAFAGSIATVLVPPLRKSTGVVRRSATLVGLSSVWWLTVVMIGMAFIRWLDDNGIRAAS
ncbi:MAG: hypothetical protein AAF297_09475 [Planctomycetota bacterium]